MVRNTDSGTQVISITAPQQIAERTIPTLERQVDDALAAKPQSVDLVMSAVQVVDSGGLNWLLAVQTRLETLGSRMRLMDPSSIITDALVATRLDSRFTIVASGNTDGTPSAGGTHGSN